MRGALLSTRFALKTALGDEEWEDSPYGDEPDEASFDDDVGAICFRWGGHRTSWLLRRGEVLETVENGGYLDCRAIRDTGRVLKTWRQALGDPALN